MKEKRFLRLQIAGLVLLAVVTAVVLFFALQQPGPPGFLPGVTNPLKK